MDRQGFEGDGGSAPEDEYEVMDALTLALDVQLDNVDAFLRLHKEHGGASTSRSLRSCGQHEREWAQTADASLSLSLSLSTSSESMRVRRWYRAVHVD